MAKTPNIDLREDYGRNYLINGNFDFWQRGSSSTSFSGYLADRWVTGGNLDGGSFTDTMSAFTLNPGDIQDATYAWRVASTGLISGGGANAHFVLEQKIEDVRTLSGKTITVNLKSRCSIGTPEIAIGALQNFGSGGSSSVFIQAERLTLSNSFEEFSVQLTIPDITGKTIGANNYLSIRLYLQAGTTTVTNQLLDGGSAIVPVSGNYDIAQVQVFEGSEALPFRRAGRNIADELRMCQRYYEKTYDVLTIPGTAIQNGQIYGIGRANTATSIDPGPVVFFKTKKRAIPTLGFFDQTGVSGWGWNNGAQVANPSIANIGEGGFSTYFGASAGLSTGLSYIVRGHWTADAEL